MITHAKRLNEIHVQQNASPKQQVLKKFGLQDDKKFLVGRQNTKTKRKTLHDEWVKHREKVENFQIKESEAAPEAHIHTKAGD